MACIYSNPEELKSFSSIKKYYLSKIKDSFFLHHLLEGKIIGEISVCSATAYFDLAPISEKFIKVGDAAFCMDPLSSQGVQKAIMSAYQGAIAVNTLLGQPKNLKLAVDYYNSMIQREIKNNTLWTKDVYNQQNKLKDGHFWITRKDPSIGNSQRLEDKRISLKKTDKLSINNKATIKSIPIVGKSMIEYLEGIILEENKEPFIFL